MVKARRKTKTEKSDREVPPPSPNATPRNTEEICDTARQNAPLTREDEIELTAAMQWMEAREQMSVSLTEIRSGDALRDEHLLEAKAKELGFDSSHKRRQTSDDCSSFEPKIPYFCCDFLSWKEIEAGISSRLAPEIDMMKRNIIRPNWLDLFRDIYGLCMQPGVLPPFIRLKRKNHIKVRDYRKLYTKHKNVPKSDFYILYELSTSMIANAELDSMEYYCALISRVDLFMSANKYMYALIDLNRILLRVQSTDQFPYNNIRVMNMLKTCKLTCISKLRSNPMPDLWIIVENVMNAVQKWEKEKALWKWQKEIAINPTQGWEDLCEPRVQTLPTYSLTKDTERTDTIAEEKSIKSSTGKSELNHVTATEVESGSAEISVGVVAENIKPGTSVMTLNKLDEAEINLNEENKIPAGLEVSGVNNASKCSPVNIDSLWRTDYVPAIARAIETGINNFIAQKKARADPEESGVSIAKECSPVTIELPSKSVSLQKVLIHLSKTTPTVENSFTSKNDAAQTGEPPTYGEVISREFDSKTESICSVHSDDDSKSKDELAGNESELKIQRMNSQDTETIPSDEVTRSVQPHDSSKSEVQSDENLTAVKNQELNSFTTDLQGAETTTSENFISMTTSSSAPKSESNETEPGTLRTTVGIIESVSQNICDLTASRHPYEMTLGVENVCASQNIAAQTTLTTDTVNMLLTKSPVILSEDTPESSTTTFLPRCKNAPTKSKHPLVYLTHSFELLEKEIDESDASAEMIIKIVSNEGTTSEKTELKLKTSANTIIASMMKSLKEKIVEKYEPLAKGTISLDELQVDRSLSDIASEIKTAIPLSTSSSSDSSGVTVTSEPTTQHHSQSKSFFRDESSNVIESETKTFSPEVLCSERIKAPENTIVVPIKLQSDNHQTNLDAIIQIHQKAREKFTLQLVEGDSVKSTARQEIEKDVPLSKTETTVQILVPQNLEESKDSEVSEQIKSQTIRPGQSEEAGSKGEANSERLTTHQENRISDSQALPSSKSMTAEQKKKSFTKITVAKETNSCQEKNHTPLNEKPIDLTTKKINAKAAKKAKRRAKQKSSANTELPETELKVKDTSTTNPVVSDTNISALRGWEDLKDMNYEWMFPPPKGNLTNSLLPNASPKIKLAFNEFWGRHFIATEEIRPGDLLMVDTPYVTMRFPAAIHTHCGNCRVRCETMIPCRSCSIEMYCGESCREKAWHSYHRIECQIMEYLVGGEDEKKFMLALRVLLRASEQGDSLMQLMKTYEIDDDFFVDTADVNKKLKTNDYESIHNLMGNAMKYLSEEVNSSLLYQTVYLLYLLQNTTFFDHYHSLFGVTSDDSEVFVASFLLKQLLTMHHNLIVVFNDRTKMGSCNGRMLTKMIPIGTGVFPMLSYLNHSCNANAMLLDFNDKVAVYATQFIMPDEQVFVDYGIQYAAADTTERRRFLYQHFHFECNCEACVQRWNYTHMLNAPRAINEATVDKHEMVQRTNILGLLSAEVDRGTNNDYNMKWLTDHLQFLCRNYMQPHIDFYTTVRLINKSIELMAKNAYFAPLPTRLMFPENFVNIEGSHVKQLKRSEDLTEGDPGRSR